MADKKLTELPLVIAANADDLLYIVNTGKKSKGIKVRDILTTQVQNYNHIISGGVIWLKGLTFRSIHLKYELNGNIYESDIEDVTLDDADATYDRIDVIFVDKDGLKKVTGIAAATPLEPTLPEPENNLKAHIVIVPAASSEPQEYFIYPVYAENLGSPTEWASTINGGFVVDNTSNPISGNVDIKTVHQSHNDILTFTGADYIQINDFNNLRLKIKLLSPLGGSSIQVTLKKDGEFVAVRQISSLIIDPNDTTNIQDVYLFEEGVDSTQTQFNEIEMKLQGFFPDPVPNIQMDDIKIQTGSDSAIGTQNKITYFDLAPDLRGTQQVQLKIGQTSQELDLNKYVAFNIKPKLTDDLTLTFKNEVENKMIKLIINLNSHALSLPSNVNIDLLDELDGGDVWEVIQIEATMMDGVLQHKAQKLM